MICKLCLIESKLCKSHVIPDFLYKRIFDEKHRLLKISNNPYRKSVIPAGFYEKLLCQKCETKISKFESYARSVWYKEFLIPQRIYEKIIIIEGLSYNLFKLFHLSILWRASVCTHPFFGNVTLGPHQDRIRKMIYDENPGNDGRYCFYCVAFVKDFELFDKMIMQPVVSKHNGHDVIIFQYGGCQWSFMISTQENLEFPLFQDGRMPVLVQKISEDKYANEFFNEHFKRG